MHGIFTQSCPVHMLLLMLDMLVWDHRVSEQDDAQLCTRALALHDTQYQPRRRFRSSHKLLSGR